MACNRVPCVDDDTAAAVAAARPVVALETSIVAQGLPWPFNLEVGQGMAAAVRRAGAVPAFAAVADGAVRLGLDASTLERFAQDGADKASARDLARLALVGGRGATTVAGTLRIAAAAGVRVIATGGIGGVHRDTDATFDVSADLEEIARTPAVVVASGAKSILDLPRTLEWLEMLGVPVLGWRTSRFPAFYVEDGGLEVPRIDDLPTLAAMAMRHWALGGGGVLVVQAPAAPLDADDVEDWTREALSEARRCGIAGGAVTPFLLAELARLSDGATLAANRALAVANAELAGALACELAARLEVDAADA